MQDDISKIRKDAWICYNGYGNKGNCSGSYKDNNKVCFYCLEFIRRITPPNKKKRQDINLKEIFDRVDKDTDTPNNEIEKSRTKIKTFRFPVSLIEFPLSKKDKNPTEKKYRNKIYIVEDLKSLYGSYQVRTPRQYKPFDIKVLLATLYFTDDFNNRIFENKFKRWLDLLDFEDTGYYRRAIIEGLDYLTNTTLYHYHAWNYKTSVRETFKKGDRLPSFSVFHILNEFHHLKERGKRKSKLRVEIGDTFYDKIKERYTYIELGKVLPLSDIALNLYMFLKKQYDKSTFVKVPYVFELLKDHIGITDKNITNARKTFDNTFKDLKDRGLVEEYDYKIELLDGTDSIRFEFVKSLTPVNNLKN